MSSYQLVGLAVRLFAIWLLISTIEIIGLGSAFRAQNTNVEFIPYLLAIFFVILSVLMWYFPMSIAYKLLPKVNNIDKLGISSLEIVRISCVILSLWIIIVSVIPTYSRYISFASFWLISGQQLSLMDKVLHISFLSATIQLAIAILLIRKSHELSTLLLRDLR